MADLDCIKQLSDRYCHVVGNAAQRNHRRGLNSTCGNRLAKGLLSIATIA